MKQPFSSSLKPLSQMLQCHYLTTLSPHIFPLSTHSHPPQNLSLLFFPPHKPTNFPALSALPRRRDGQWIAEIPESTTAPRTTSPEEGGPVELPPSSPTIFATTDDPSPLQVATSVLLTGAISVFLFRSIRRRARRAKELKFRSSGAEKTLKEEALDSLKAMGSTPIGAKSAPSPVQAFLGGISAGVIALILYKFTTTIEAALNRQTLSDSFSVRQITITIRTILNGLCYLATFVFGINSVGLFLYSAQLGINSFMGDSNNEETESKGTGQSSSENSTFESPTDSLELNRSQGDQSPDEKQK